MQTLQNGEVRLLRPSNRTELQTHTFAHAHKHRKKHGRRLVRPPSPMKGLFTEHVILGLPGYTDMQTRGGSARVECVFFHKIRLSRVLSWKTDVFCRGKEHPKPYVWSEGKMFFKTPIKVACSFRRSLQTVQRKTLANIRISTPGVRSFTWPKPAHVGPPCVLTRGR